VLVLGVVMTVALWRAKPEDVPEVLQVFTLAFSRMIDSLPGWRDSHLRRRGSEVDTEGTQMDGEQR